MRTPTPDPERRRDRWVPGPGRAAVLAFGALVAVCLALSLEAGPPYLTDDSETPRERGWEINLPFVLARSNVSNQAQIPLFDLNYGLTDSFQLDLEVPVFRVRQAGQPPATGLGDAMFGVKCRVLEETKASPQVAVYPEVVFPTGSASRGLGAGAFSYVLPVAVEKNWGKWTAYANLGYYIQTAAGAEDYLYYGAVLTREVAGRLEVGAEVFGNTSPAVGVEADDGFNMGAELQVSRSLVLLGSVGHSFHKDGYFLAYFGIQLLTGPNRGAQS